AEVTPSLDRGVVVRLSATVTGGGCGVSAPSYTYEWSLQGRPAGSTAQLDDPVAAAPSFVLDVADGTWQIMLVVRDQLGNATSALASITSRTCGGRPPVISGLPATQGVNTFQLQAFSVSAPDPDAGCPSRFLDPVAFSWTVVSKPAGAPAPTFS